MYGYSFGAAEVGLRHKITDNLMIYPGYTPREDVEPILMHYGLPFSIGYWSFSKWKRARFTLMPMILPWIQYLPSLLFLLDDKSPSCSKSVLHLQLCVAQAAPVNSPFFLGFDNLQYNFRGLFSQMQYAMVPS